MYGSFPNNANDGKLVLIPAAIFLLLRALLSTIIHRWNWQLLDFLIMHNLCDLRVALLAKIGRNSHLNKVTVNNTLATAVARANALLRLVRK